MMDKGLGRGKFIRAKEIREGVERENRGRERERRLELRK